MSGESTRFMKMASFERENYLPFVICFIKLFTQICVNLHMFNFMLPSHDTWLLLNTFKIFVYFPRYVKLQKRGETLNHKVMKPCLKRGESPTGFRGIDNIHIYEKHVFIL